MICENEKAPIGDKGGNTPITPMFVFPCEAPDFCNKIRVVPKAGLTLVGKIALFST